MGDSKELNSQGSELTQVAFTPDSAWVILYNTNGVEWSDGTPQDLADKLVKLNDDDRELKQVAFDPDSDWVVLYDHNDAAWGVGVLTNAVDKIKALNSGSE